jgi:hypothetical protein
MCRNLGMLLFNTAKLILFIFRQVPAKKRRTVREDPFVFLPDNDEEFKLELENIYGIGKSFPFKNLLVRNINNENKRCIYMTNSALRDFIQNNSSRFNLVNAGVNVMRRVEKIGCSNYRLSQDVSTELRFGHFILLFRESLRFFLT